MRFLKALSRFLLSAHVLALVSLAAVAWATFRHVGMVELLTPLNAVLSVVSAALLVVSGWLAGLEAARPRARRLALELERAHAHAAYLRNLNATMIDDVLLAARHGVPVKSFSYASQAPQTGEIEVTNCTFSDAKEQAAFDLSGRL